MVSISFVRHSPYDILRNLSTNPIVLSTNVPFLDQFKKPDYHLLIPCF